MFADLRLTGIYELCLFPNCETGRDDQYHGSVHLLNYYVLSTVQRVLRESSHLICQQSDEVDYFITPILQMRRPRLKEVKWHGEGRAAIIEYDKTSQTDLFQQNLLKTPESPFLFQKERLVGAFIH